MPIQGSPINETEFADLATAAQIQNPRQNRPENTPNTPDRPGDNVSPIGETRFSNLATASQIRVLQRNRPQNTLAVPNLPGNNATTNSGGSGTLATGGTPNTLPRRLPPRLLPSAHRTPSAGGQFNNDPRRAPRVRYGEHYDMASFNYGDVLALVYHKNDTISSDGTYRNWSKADPYISKCRKFLLTELWKNHWVGLPITTFGGRGLTLYDRGSIRAYDEYLGIRDAAAPEAVKNDPGDFHRNYSYSRNIIAERIGEHVHDPLDAFAAMHPKSYVHLTHPVSFEYDVYCLRQAKVSPEDMNFVWNIINPYPDAKEATADKQPNANATTEPTIQPSPPGEKTSQGSGGEVKSIFFDPQASAFEPGESQGSAETGQVETSEEILVGQNESEGESLSELTRVRSSSSVQVMETIDEIEEIETRCTPKKVRKSPRLGGGLHARRLSFMQQARRLSVGSPDRNRGTILTGSPRMQRMGSFAYEPRMHAAKSDNTSEEQPSAADKTNRPENYQNPTTQPCAILRAMSLPIIKENIQTLHPTNEPEVASELPIPPIEIAGKRAIDELIEIDKEANGHYFRLTAVYITKDVAKECSESFIKSIEKDIDKLRATRYDILQQYEEWYGEDSTKMLLQILLTGNPDFGSWCQDRFQHFEVRNFVQSPPRWLCGGIYSSMLQAIDHLLYEGNRQIFWRSPQGRQPHG